MSNKKNELFARIPSIDKLLHSDALKDLVQSYGHNSVRDEARALVEGIREDLRAESTEILNLIETGELQEWICKKATARVLAKFQVSLKPVYNLTGTVIHTNLGRSCLPEEAIEAMMIAAGQATNLEFDLQTGKRGDRDSHLEKEICEITGAEAATVVNNNAAAVLLVLNTLAVGKEVPISRGELVEIGGAFRIPEVMASAGCILKEIGATNRTHLKDYANSINSNTALLMKVHTSNYEILGFTKSVPEREIATLAQENNLPFVCDLGSGTLVDLQQYGLPGEPTVGETLANGADIVTFSGDKLLGGPQAGVIVGKKVYIDKLKSNPLKRALRVDKCTIAALVEVINLYSDPQRLPQRLPGLRDLTRSAANIKNTALELLPVFEEILKGRAKVELVQCKSQIGSGALPLDTLDSFAIAIKPLEVKGQTDAILNALASQFRELPKPVLGRISDGRLFFDIRCLWDAEVFCQQLKNF